MDGLYVHLSAERGSDWLPEDRCRIKFRTVVIIVDNRKKKHVCTVSKVKPYSKQEKHLF